MHAEEIRLVLGNSEAELFRIILPVEIMRMFRIFIMHSYHCV